MRLGADIPISIPAECRPSDLRREITSLSLIYSGCFARSFGPFNRDDLADTRI
jgi:hypothetical protein